MSKVLVLGGAGRTGALVAKLAAERGDEVTVGSRHPGEPAAGIAATVRVDVQDGASVAQAILGQDAVVLAVSSERRYKGTMFSDAAHNIVAAGTPGLRTLIISSGGVEYEDPALPFWFRRIIVPLTMKDAYDDMRIMEQTVRDSDLAWTIVRATWLNNKRPTARFRVEDGSTPRGGWKLSRADLAQFTVAQLHNGEWLHRLPTLAD